MDSLIRWQKKDYSRLRYAINKFNKTVNKIEVDERSVLPSLKNYKDIKNHITTRKELNRVINSLNKANMDNLTKTEQFESGQRVTKWEYNEVRRSMRRAFQNLEKERETILAGRTSIGMGDVRLSEISAMEESLASLEYQSGSDFKRIKERAFNLGRTDYKLAKEKLFMDNFYKALEDISNFEDYDKLKKELNKIKNPHNFYEYVKRSPVLMDIFLWYKGETVYGGYTSNEEAFHSTLENDLGINLY